METNTLKPKTLEMVEKYLGLNLPERIACPYFNNKTGAKMAGLGVQIGKGTPKEIVEEVKIKALSSGLDLQNLKEEELKKFLAENNIGIDCLGLVYHILNTENKERNFGTLSSHFKFSGNVIRKIIRKMRPAQNSDVIVFDKNSKDVSLRDTEPGDFLVSLNQKEAERNHIILILETKKEDGVLKELTYLHSIAWTKNGLNDNGVRTGTIKIVNPDLPILNQTWIEREKTSEENETFRGLNSAESVKIKRLKWW